MDEIADFIASRFVDWMKYGFNRLFVNLKDANLARAFGTTHDDCLRLLYCGLLSRDSGRAMSEKKMRQYLINGKILVEKRCCGADKKNYYRFFTNRDEVLGQRSPMDEDQSQLWHSFLTNLRLHEFSANRCCI